MVVFSFPETPWEPPFLEAIQARAHACGGTFHEARQVGGPRWEHFWKQTTVDLLLAVSWRYLVPAHVYRQARRGSFVFHDSLLPRYRGFAPTVWAMLNGESETGATLFAMTDEVDAGDIVDQQTVPIGPDDRIADTMEAVTLAYLDLLERNLSALLAGTAPRRPQTHAEATYTCKRLPEDNRIDWHAPATRIHNLVRATTFPYPGAYTQFSGRRLRVWSTARMPQARPYIGAIPGRVVEVHPGLGVVVLTGDTPLLVQQVQLDGESVTCAAEILNRVGQTMGT
ncbi:MAG: methionyl-tRNA formyltransferase-like protein [Planctomycetia bacterium]|nr:methionyl-tRNA formyltransferase-like protein [Planctomycetia bacterium]